MAEVIMPKMGDAMEEGTLLTWHKQDGEAVQAGEVIAEIETDKSNVEVEAEEAGVLRIQAKAGTVVPVGKVIATIGAAGNGAAKAAETPAPAPNTNGSKAPEPQVGQQGTAIFSRRRRAGQGRHERDAAHC